MLGIGINSALYKDAAGEEWKPGCTPPSSGGGNASAIGEEESLKEQIFAQYGSVRKLKSAKAEKQAIDAAVKTLLELKAKYREKLKARYKVRFLM